MACYATHLIAQPIVKDSSPLSYFGIFALHSVTVNAPSQYAVRANAEKRERERERERVDVCERERECARER